MTILAETLSTIQKESGKPDLSFSLVDKLLTDYGEENLASRLYDEIEEELDWRIIADLFGILIWSTSDNGDELTKETESWLLEAKDTRKIRVALGLDVFPFKDRNQMEKSLNSIKIKFPELESMCENLILSRRKQNA